METATNVAPLQAAIEHIAQRPEPEIRWILGDALRHAGSQLTDAGHDGDALIIYDALIHWLRDSDDLSLQAVVAQARVNRAGVLGTVEGPAAAIAAFDEVAATYRDFADVELQEAAARAMRAKAVILRLEGRHHEALALDRELVERFADSDDEETLDHVGRALHTAAYTALNLLKRFDEGDELLAQSVELFGNCAGSPLQAHAINSLYNRGVIRARAGDPEGALREWDRAIAMWQQEPDTDIPEIQAAVARVWVAKGPVLQQMGEVDEARRQYEAVFSCCDRTEYPEVATAVCNAANNLMVHTLDLEGDVEGCLPALEAAIARAFAHDDDETSDAVVHALLMKAFAEWKLGRHDDAINTYDAIITLYQTSPELTAKVAEAMYNKALRLQELGRAREALAVLDTLIDEYSASDDPAAQEIAASSEEIRAEIRSEGSSDA